MTTRPTQPKPLHVLNPRSPELEALRPLLRDRGWDLYYLEDEEQPRTAAALTAGQYKVALLRAQGLSYTTIGERLGRRYETVKSHLAQVYRKLGTKTPAGLLRALVPAAVGGQSAGGRAGEALDSERPPRSSGQEPGQPS